MKERKRRGNTFEEEKNEKKEINMMSCREERRLKYIKLSEIEKKENKRIRQR